MADQDDLAPLITAKDDDAKTTMNTDEILILGELVGGFNLSNEEHAQSAKGSLILKEKHLKPYCVVKFQGKTIHYSSVCPDAGRDPIWTVSTGSLFLFKVSPSSSLLHDKLQISIWSRRNSSSFRGKVLLDTDTFFLGKATIDGKTLLSSCNEERMEIPLMDLHGNPSMSDSSVALRFRLATKSDVRLLDLLREQGISPPRESDASFGGTKGSSQNNPVRNLILGEGSNLPIAPMITEADETKMVGEYFTDALSFAFRQTSTSDRETGMRKVLIKPGPDPEREVETKFMTPVNLSKETMNPSKQWVEAGSGHLGTLHLEILSCHDLPNVDVGEAVGNLSDCFVCAVFEDVMVQTPVIDDELSPHWLPWTQRAFRIGIVHPASTLYLGVLDYDLGPGTHEPIGRVAVNLSNYQCNMLYTLTFHLHPTSDLAERSANGSITIRMRIEYHDEKASIVAAMKPPPPFHVNARKHKTFKVLRYTCFGEYDIEEKFAWPITRSYIGEILEYWRGLKFYMGQAIQSLVFWRGQVTIFGMHLPVHSAVLFVACAVLIEKPWLIVPFYSLFVAWFLLATMSHRRATPSPWRTCNSFLHYAEIILTGKASDTRERIRPSEMWDKTQAFEKDYFDWREKYQNEINQKAAMDEKLMNIGNENISTQVAGQMVPLELLEKLGRYQGTAGRLCRKLRTVKSILIWEESLTSFWITAICLAGGFVGLLLPWKFILYHGGRTIVWGGMGPHMRLVDAYLRSSSDDDEVKTSEEFRKQSRLARIRREEAVKLKDMKCLAYGEFVTLIPGFNLPRHYDHALHMSSAVRIPSSAKPKKAPASSRIPGQQLYGSMIPHTKAGLSLLQEEAKETEAIRKAVAEQLARLESIKTHVSSRHLNPDQDNELPDDLGYEMTMCDDDTDEPEEEKRAPSRMPSDYKVSLSQIGFDTSADDAQVIDLERKQRLGKPASRVMAQSIEEEKKSWDMEDYGSFDASSDKAGEQDGSSFLTPLQLGDDEDAKADMSFITPEQGPQHEKQTENQTASSPLRFLELKLKDLDCMAAQPEEPPTTQQNFGSGPKDQCITRQRFTESTERDSNLPKEQSTGVRRTWSNSEVRNEKIWIKASPTDSLLNVKATQRKSSVKLEEGLEVVAMGRLRTMGDELAEGYSNDDVDEDSGEESESSHHGLSNPFESSEHIQVATYRP